MAISGEEFCPKNKEIVMSNCVCYSHKQKLNSQ